MDALLLSRRLMMSQFAPTPPPPLDTPIYWWSGEDALVNGEWVDRVSSLPFVATSTAPAQSGGGYTCSKAAKGEGYFSMNMNANSPAGLRIGTHWRIEVEFEIVAFGNQTCMVADFGSLANASRAFGISIPSPYDSINDNWKGLGNTSFATYGTQIDLGAAIVPGDKHTVVLGCEAYDSSQDIQFMRWDGGSKVYGSGPHTPVAFNANFNTNTAYIGRGGLTNYCDGIVKVYSIKIYNDD